MEEGGKAGGVGGDGLGRELERINVEERELEEVVVIGINGGGVADVSKCKEYNKKHFDLGGKRERAEGGNW